MNKKDFKINGRKYRCVSYYCYNSHYNMTVFDITDESPEYLGEIKDLQFDTHDFMTQLESWIKKTCGVLV